MISVASERISYQAHSLSPDVTDGGYVALMRTKAVKTKGERKNQKANNAFMPKHPLWVYQEHSDWLSDIIKKTKDTIELRPVAPFSDKLDVYGFVTINNKVRVIEYYTKSPDNKRFVFKIVRSKTYNSFPSDVSVDAWESLISILNLVKARGELAIPVIAGQYKIDEDRAARIVSTFMYATQILSNGAKVE